MQKPLTHIGNYLYFCPTITLKHKNLLLKSDECTMNHAEKRRQSQINFLKSGQEIEVGNKADLPLSLDEILSIDKDSKFVEQVFSSGLTAIVYKIKVNNQFYNLKKKRDKILVLNVDGQTSFLNEVQRRRDFEIAKQTHPEEFKGIVDTIYASLNHGFILSKWIEGDFISHFSPEILDNIFQTQFEIEKIGLFECDLSKPNMLVDENNLVHFFDFGYMYPYNPLKDFNSDGKEIPIFHVCERLESRFLMQQLMNIENNQGFDLALSVYQSTKEAALKIYKKKLDWLEANKADNEVIMWQSRFIQLWENGLKSRDELIDIYQLESFRSYVLDVHDDIGGKSCTPATLQKTGKILQIIQNRYDFLTTKNGLFWGDELLNKESLLEKYRQLEEKVVEYQL